MNPGDEGTRAVPCGDCWVLMDSEDAEVLGSLLACGWRLRLVKDRRRSTDTPTLSHRAHGSIALSRAIMQATESQHVVQRGPSGPLDCRRSQMELQDAGRRIGWASKINGSGARTAANA